MLIDLPESAVQIINERAEMQGVSVAELIMQTFDKPEIFANSDVFSVELNNEQFNQILDRLEQPPKKNPKLQALLALSKDMWANNALWIIG